MKLFVIVNGASAGGRTAKRWPRIEAALTSAGLDHEVAFTDGPGHATALVTDALGSGHVAIASCGGDGTLNEVVNGLVGADGSALAPGTKLAIIPSGTGGDFRKTLGIDADPPSAAQLIRDGHTRTIDAGLIEYEGREQPRRFVNIASCGVGYEVDRRINNLRFKPGRLAYAMVSGYSILSYRAAPAKVVVDGTPVSGAFSSISLANGRCFGGGMMIAPKADPGDGLLDVVLSSTTRLRSLTGARRLYDGSHLGRPGSLMLRGGRIQITPAGESRMGFDVDGEAIGFAPATISALPGVLEIFAPR
jgi:YegS/Rv2252/BmrU family lipid kinase